MGKLILFHVPIEGVEEGDVEALPSYLLRLAQEHSVSMPGLIALVTRQSCQHVREDNYNFGKSVRAWIELSPNAIKLTPTIQALTEQPVLAGTTRVFGAHKTNISTYFRWCPICLSDMLESYSITYFKLIWQLLDVANCHIHNVELFSKCHHCGAHQNMHLRAKPLHFCQACGKSLCDKYVYRYLKSERGNSELDIYLLFKYLALNKYKLIEQELAETSCKDLLEIYGSLQLRPSGTKIRCSTLIDILGSLNLSNLRALRIVAKEYQVPLYSLVAGEAKYVTSRLGLDVNVCSFEQIQSSELSKRIMHEDNSYIYEKVRELQQRFACTAPHGKLADSLSTSVDLLQKSSQSLCAQLGLEHYNHSQKNLESVFEFVRAFLLEQLWKYPNKDPYKLKVQVLGELQCLTALNLETLNEIFEGVLDSLRY